MVVIVKRCFGFISKANRRIFKFDIFSKNGPQLSQIVRIASQKKYDDEKFWSLIKTRLQYISDTLSARDLSFIANGFCRAGFRDVSDWECIISRTYELSDKLGNQDIALLFNAMCKLEGLDPKIFRFLAEQIKKKSGEMSHTYASMIIYSLGRIKMYDQSLMNVLLKSIKNNLNKMSLISISSLINGFYHLNNYDLKLMNQLVGPIKKNLELYKNSEPEKLSQSVPKFSNLIEMKTIVSIYQAYCHSGICDKELYNLLFEYMIENSGQLKLVEMIIISNSMNASKLHKRKLIEIMNKKISRRPKLYDYDGIAMYLKGLMNDKYIPRESTEKLMSVVGFKKYKGSLNVKNSIIFLQIMSKFDFVNDKLYQFVIEYLMSNKDQLKQSDLSKLISCCNCLDMDHLKIFTQQFFDIFELEHDESAQQLSTMLYYLKKLNEPEFEESIDRILGYFECVEIRKLEVVNVVNMLYSLETVKDSQSKTELLNKCIEYLNSNINKFSNQLLSSALSSLVKLKRVDDEILNKFCKRSQVLDGYSNLKDNLKLLKFLNSYNYFRETEDENLIRIVETYKIVLNNITGKRVDSEHDCNRNDFNNEIHNNKIQVNGLEEDVVQESHNILKTIECKLELKNKVDIGNKALECSKEFKKTSINV